MSSYISYMLPTLFFALIAALALSDITAYIKDFKTLKRTLWLNVFNTEAKAANLAPLPLPQEGSPLALVIDVSERNHNFDTARKPPWYLLCLSEEKIEAYAARRVIALVRWDT